MRPLPAPDRDSRAWWEALTRHELVVQGCDRCGHLRWPPRELCSACGGFGWSWRATSGRATVASWIVNHHPFGNAFPSPYTVVAARLDEQEDIVVPGGYSGPADGGGLAIGAALSVEYEDVAAEGAHSWTLIRWRSVEPITAP